MLRKFIFFIILASFLAFLPIQARAVYDPTSVANNRFGIHVLDTSEVGKAKELVNANGGDWGYVTIPIRANDRDLDKWTKFMESCRSLHLIPILRIASFPVGDHWMAPNEYDLLDFANFLSELPWPVNNRYIIVYNEPNHDNEWGGFVYPQEYARVLDRATDIFHKKNQDFFVISAGMDSSSVDTNNSMNEYEYMQKMENAIPGVLKRVDGISSHSYGNPGFSAAPNVYSSVNVANFRQEENFLKQYEVLNPKIFITEAGWKHDVIGQDVAANYYKQAFSQIWTDSNIVAVTPFLLSAADGPFVGFSFTEANGNFRDFAKVIMQMPKVSGKPQLAQQGSGIRGQEIGQTTVNLKPNMTSDKFGLILKAILRFLNIHGS